jgi:uncharacterized membrane protein
LITNPIAYLLILALLASGLYLLEEKRKLKIFTYLPAVVLVYACAMFLASIGLFAQSDTIATLYKTTKQNLLPAMLFLMLLEVDFKDFLRLGKQLVNAYILALFSIGLSFIIVALFFNFSHDMAAAFGALAGSWMGGTANMVAVGSALGVKEDAFAYALLVDSVDYTIWVMLLLFLVPFAKVFDRFTGAKSNYEKLGNIGCACSMGAKRYWLLLASALFVSFIVQITAEHITLINKTTTTVLLASLLGVIGSFTKLRNFGGISELSTSMLYMLVALIGSQASFGEFNSLLYYIFAGLAVLILHACIMVVGAKLFRLDLFSISVASLANIGGVASAPILAASYNKRLVSVGVLMAVMGYLVGTVGGLFIGKILLFLAHN